MGHYVTAKGVTNGLGVEKMGGRGPGRELMGGCPSSSPWYHSDRHSLTQDILAQNVPMNRMPSGVRRREIRDAKKRNKG